jgi:DNA-binding CsgD family transcriptional regulator
MKTIQDRAPHPPLGTQPGEAGSPGTGAKAAVPELTPRQQQILELLRAGKVNKEIAKELGIEIGTVKQHVVALFKRLNVSNRTMAVSRGLALLGERPQPEPAPPALADGILERRPCVVLSLALPEPADDASVRRLHGTLAALAFDQDAVFLARRGHAGDIIFGLHQASERDLMKAVQTARQVHEDLLSHAPDLAGGMRGGMTAGLVVASMLRTGGWSGEAIVSTAIAAARELQAHAPPGRVAIGMPALDLMKAFGIRGEAVLSGNDAGIRSAGFSALSAFDWSGDRASYLLVGREAEIETFREILTHAGGGKGQLVFLEGETGMGKSRLCREIMGLCQAMGGKAVFYRVQADAGNRVRDQESGHTTDTASALQGLAAAPGAPSLAIVDDCHFLSRESRRTLVAAASEAAQTGWAVVLSGRHMPDIDRSNAETIRLQRQSTREIESLVRQVLGTADAQAMHQVQHIAKDAAGVPLFAVELARHPGEGAIAMSLLVTIAARLDGLRLDRKLLRAVARGNPPPTADEVAGMLGEDSEVIAEAARRALATGVLQADNAGHLAFAHPLLRKITDYVSLE